VGSQAREPVTVEDCDLCIVGAGICGLNFLFSASQHMSKEDRVVLVDRKPGVGGMWNDTYPYVRLHQPHPMFTVGNFSWSLDKERSHLATREEVLGHFDECMDRLRDTVTLVERYGYAYEEHEEVHVDGGVRVEARLRPTASDDDSLLVRTPRLVKAFGMRVPRLEPLALSSQKVVSISPLDLDLLEHGPEDTPVYVVGGGKTGMDAAQAVLTRFPEREVRLIIGKGTIFWNRDKMFPSGLKRWWGGQMVMPAFLELALRFDGTNEAEVHEYLKQEYTLSLNDRCDRFFSALLSEAENAFIKEHVDEVVQDYLVDVVDVDDRPVMKLRSGAEREVDPGSYVVACTGSLLREKHPYEPYVSGSGATVSIQATSGVYGFQSFSGYWLGQLLFAGNLLDVPLYALDYQRLFATDKKAFTFAWMTQLLYNTILIMDAVPPRALKDCGLNFDNWYPPYRQLPFLLKLKMNKGSYLEHFRGSLDRVRERTEVRGGPLAAVE
jgi:hypothetical protein